MRQRYYNQSTGRFTRRDSYEGRFGEPLTLHKYGYTHSNPINYIDPSGLAELTMQDFALAFGILALLAVSPYVTNAYNAEPLGGFNDDEHLSIPNHTGGVISELLKLQRLGGFEGSQPQHARSIQGFPIRTADDLIAYIFSADTAKLRANMQGEGYSFSRGEHAHHIVPVNISTSIYARSVLNSYGIDVDDAVNGVGLSEREHLGRGYHTAEDIYEVTNRIISLDTKAEVEAELRQIAAEMQAGTFRF